MSVETWRSPHGRALPVIGERTLVMGVLNVTPDSFSDGGELADVDATVQRAVAMALGLSDIPEPADVADALAIALCCESDVTSRTPVEVLP